MASGEVSAQGTPKGEGPLDRQLQERRNDPEFRERLERSIEENKALLKSLGEKGIEPLVEPSPPDHNPEQLTKRLRGLAGDFVKGTEYTEREAGWLTEAANLLDYYASVVEGLRVKVEEWKQKAAEAETPGRVDQCFNHAYGLEEAIAALQHAQSKAEPKEEQ